MSFGSATYPLTRRGSWYTYPYPPLVWVSRDEARPEIGANTPPRDQFFWASRVQKLGVCTGTYTVREDI